MHLERRSDSIIDNHYQVLKVLGRGGSGITYAAKDLTTGNMVALKELSLKGLDDWKKLELFEREAQILQQISYPFIPQYLDYFSVEHDDNQYFYIVQELIKGRSLANLIAAGKRFSETEVRYIAIKTLRILNYLHGLTPPIVHRDIKPGNIIFTREKSVFLVDFGAVQSIYQDTMTFGSTVVGTYGYMAPEQFRGQFSPLSDLYSLGATLLHVLSHQPPGDLPQKNLKLDVYSLDSLSPKFAKWLDQLVEPMAEDRFKSANLALLELTRPKRKTDVNLNRPPKGSRIQLQRTDESLRLMIPPNGLRLHNIDLYLICSIFGANCGAFLTIIIKGFIDFATPLINLVPLIAFFVIGILCMSPILRSLFLTTSLTIDAESFSLRYQLLLWKQVIRGNTKDLNNISIDSHYSVNKPVYVLYLHEGILKHPFGRLLRDPEKNWLLTELRDFLQKIKARQ